MKLADGESVSLRAPTYSLTDLAYGPISPDIMISPRVAPPMIGLGLLEAVPEEQILANADPDDASKDGISGKPNRVWSREHDNVMLGRFGWKAGIPTIAQQAAEAFNGDIGICHDHDAVPARATAPRRRRPASTRRTAIRRNIRTSRSATSCSSWWQFYSQNLAVPARRKPDDPEVLKGKDVFYTNRLRQLPSAQIRDRRGARPAAFVASADLALHRYAAARHGRRSCRRIGPRARRRGSEWRTPPLWGIGLTETVSGHTLFLHDGRARNLTEAILWHGGEAEAARDRFAELSQADRDALLAFVNSL